MKNIHLNFLIICVFALLTFTACEQKSDSEKAQEEIEEAGEAIGDAFRTEQEELRHDMEEAQEKIDQKLDKLRADLDNASENAKADIQKQIDKWEIQRDALTADLERLGDNIREGWQDFKNDVKRSLDKIDKEIEENS